MNRIKTTGTGFTIFLVFFGLALLDSVRAVNWWHIAFWLGIGSLFLLFDNTPAKKKSRR